MAKRSGLSISVKMILTSTLLVLLIVAGFGIMNIINIRDVYDTTASEKIESFRQALQNKGETTTQIFAQAMLTNLINNADDDIKLIVTKTANQDPELKLIYILSRDKRVVAYCQVTRDSGELCDPGRYRRESGLGAELQRIEDASWKDLESVWQQRVTDGNSDALVGVEHNGESGRTLLFAYPVFSGGRVPTPQSALDEDAGDSRQGFVVLGYDLAPIDRFAEESRSNKRRAERASIIRTGAFGALFVLIGTVLAILQGLGISRPLKLLAWKADQIARGDLKARVEVSSADEIGLLGENFNFMADQLVVLMRQTREKATMDKELEVARTIQETLVPSHEPFASGPFELAGHFQPASQCGGDWWTYHQLKGGRILVVIGDVTGHGVSSAMITATAKAACDVARAVNNDDVPVTKLLEIMNNAIYESAKRKFVMTCFAAIIDPHARTITYANAGHNFPYLYRVGANGKGDFLALMIRGNRLGDLRDSKYEANTTSLEPGDILIWYTDGIVECENKEGEEYGERRFRASIRHAANLSAGQLRDSVIKEALAFYGTTVRKDDITMIVGRVS